MFRILDRYVVREVLPPFFLGLTVLTFILEMPPILEYAEKFIEKGVDWLTIIRLLATLLPQALGLTMDPAVAAQFARRKKEEAEAWERESGSKKGKKGASRKGVPSLPNLKQLQEMQAGLDDLRLN